MLCDFDSVGAKLVDSMEYHNELPRKTFKLNFYDCTCHVNEIVT